MLKKIFKRLICLCFLFISFGFVNAYAGPSDGSGITLVAEISIHSFGNKYVEEAGHSFLTIKNTGSRAIYVGKMYVSSGKTVSIGNWGNLGEHSGLWYNMETYYDSINRYLSLIHI